MRRVISGEIIKQTRILRSWAKFYYPKGRFSLFRYLISHIGVFVLLMAAEIGTHIGDENFFLIMTGVDRTILLVIFLLVPLIAIGGLLLIAKMADKYNLDEQWGFMLLIYIIALLVFVYANWTGKLFEWKIVIITQIILFIILFARFFFSKNNT